MDPLPHIEARYREIIDTFERSHVTERTGFYVAVMDIKWLLAEIDRLRGNEAEIARLQKAEVGVCASCGRDDRVVYFDREAMVCADYDDCWAASRARDAEMG